MYIVGLDTMLDVAAYSIASESDIRAWIALSNREFELFGLFQLILYRIPVL